MRQEEERDRLSVYLVFAEPGGELVQAASSLVGAGAAVVSHAACFCGTTDLILQDGQPFEVGVIAAMLPMDGAAYVRAADGDEPIASIERRLLAP